jgi:hypothetical protein
MTPTTEQASAQTTTAPDLATAVQRVLAASPEPLTLPRIRDQLPAPFRSASIEELADFLRRQAAVNVFYQFPRYRSRHDRFWDRPIAVHVAILLRAALEESPLPWSDLRRKLPGYAVAQAETVLNEQVAQGLLYRHPRTGSRGGDRFGVRPPDPKDYLRPALAQVFRDLEQLGFTESQLREGALELLHDEEWSPARSELVAPPERAQPKACAEHSDEAAAGPPDEPAASLEAGKTQAAITQAETHPEAPDVSTQ